MQSVYTAKHGLQAQQQRMDVLASNIANVSTTGYKGQNAQFKDALYTQMINPADTGSTVNLKQGSGVLLSSAYRDFTDGTPQETGEALDLYIEGDGFFYRTKQQRGDPVYAQRRVLGFRGGERAVSRDGGRILCAGYGRQPHCAA